MTKMDYKEIRKAEYENRKNVVAALRVGIEDAAALNHTDPKKNIEYCRNQFKQTLAEMDIPFTLLTVRAMIEGAVYIEQAQKLGNITFGPDMSLALLMLFEEEMIRERDEKMKNLENL